MIKFGLVEVVLYKASKEVNILYSICWPCDVAAGSCLRTTKLNTGHPLKLRENVWEYRNFECKTLQISLFRRFQLQEQQYTTFQAKRCLFWPYINFKNSSHITIICTLLIFPDITTVLWFEKLERSISVWEVFIKQSQSRDNDYPSVLHIVCSRLSVYSMVGWGKTRVSSEKNKEKGERMRREDHIVPPQSSCTLFRFLPLAFFFVCRDQKTAWNKLFRLSS